MSLNAKDQAALALARSPSSSKHFRASPLIQLVVWIPSSLQLYLEPAGLNQLITPTLAATTILASVTQPTLNSSLLRTIPLQTITLLVAVALLPQAPNSLTNIPTSKCTNSHNLLPPQLQLCHVTFSSLECYVAESHIHNCIPLRNRGEGIRPPSSYSLQFHIIAGWIY